MAAELVNSATSEKLTERDWTKNIEICELVAYDQRQAKDVIKAIKKRLGSKHANTQLFAVLLLEMLMNNIGENIHKQVVDAGIIPILVKIVKKKSDLPIRERIFLLLDATQASVGGSSGKFPQYYNAYYDLVNAGVQFPQRTATISSTHQTPQPNNNSGPTGELPYRHEEVAQQAETQTIPELSIIQKATNALEVLKEVLDAIESQNSEGAKDEFTLDLVEQCSFQKQKVMHLVMTSRDEKMVSKAIDLNEKLQKVLTRHEALLSARSTLTASHVNREEAEEEEAAEQLSLRLRKGKACARPEDEEGSPERLNFGLLGSSIHEEMLNRPLIRPLSLEPPRELNGREPNGHLVPFVIPPPPSKHIERQRFFQENKVDGLVSHTRGLSLHSRNGSSSHSGSIDSNEL